MAFNLREKRDSIKNTIQGAKQSAKNYLGARKGNKASDDNIRKLIHGYGVSYTTSHKGDKYTKLVNHVKGLFKKGKAKEAREYLKKEGGGN